MARGNITATSLKMLWKNLYSVKCYDKLNMNVFTLSLWENIWWGLIYFDQFICDQKSRLGHDLPILVNGRVILPFREDFIITNFRENNTIAKISEFTLCNDYHSQSLLPHVYWVFLEVIGLMQISMYNLELIAGYV